MVEAIAFLQKRGPDFGYHLNMDKSIYLMSPPAGQALSEEQLEDRISQLMDLGIPRANIKIHPKCTVSCSSSLAAERQKQFGTKVLGTYVGTTDFIEAHVNIKLQQLIHVSDVLVKYPNLQGRCLLHAFAFNPRVNYFLRTHFPEHTRSLVNAFENLQMKLVASYHGNNVQLSPEQRSYLCDRVSLQISNGGLSTGSVKHAHLASFLASLVATVAHLAKVFPSWANLDVNGNIVTISENRNLELTNKIKDVVVAINQESPGGPLQGLVSLTAIFQKLYVVDDNNQIADQLQ